MPKKPAVKKTPEKQAPAQPQLNVVQPKQTLRTARSGETYVFESDEWRIGRLLLIPWTALEEKGLTRQVASELLVSFRKIMAELVEEVSESHARGVFDQIVALLTYCRDAVTIEAFETRRAALAEQGLAKQSQGQYLGLCRNGILAWDDGKYPGLEAGLVDHVNEIKIGTAISGRAVREQCPVRGPFTEPEEAALIRWLHQTYAEETLSLQHYAIFMLELDYGCRPVELGALRASDVLEREDGQGYEIRIPTAKGERDYRQSFRTLELSADMYALLKEVIQQGQVQLANVWGQPISPVLSKQLPLFVGQRLLAAGSSEAFEHRVAKTPSTFDINAFSYLQQSIRKCPVTTERLEGDLLPLSLYRFRRTVATRLAQAGASDEIIAAVFGHANTQTAKTYTEHTYADQEACDEIMSEAWLPVIDQVASRLLDKPIPGQARVHVSRDEEVGNCAQLCGGGILTCYPCVKFKPFVDAPHEKALAFAESLKQSRIDAGMSGSEVDSLELPIAAIKATIRACQVRKQEEAAHG